MIVVRNGTEKQEPFSNRDIQRCRKLNKWFRDANDPIAKGILQCIKKMDFDLNKITFSWCQPNDSSQEIVSFIYEGDERDFSFNYNYRDAKPDQGQAINFQEHEIDKNVYFIRAALIVRNESKT